MIDNTAKIIKHKVGLLNLAEELGNRAWGAMEQPTHLRIVELLELIKVV